MPFQNDNINVGLPADNQFQVGVSNVDPSSPGGEEKGFLLPYPSDPGSSWVYYECHIEAFLDSGIVVHNRLPQVDHTPDTLSSCDYADSRLADLGTVNADGVNLRSNDDYTDIVQRMAHSRYWFRLYGQALRVGHQVPIPRIVSIGGVPVVPYDAKPQWAFNKIAPGGNYSGFILWQASWSLWYTTAVPPRTNIIPANNPAAAIDSATPPPSAVQSPYDQPDDSAVPAAPPLNAVPILGLVNPINAVPR